jgi:DNA-3-methyladenine glycosylase II
MTIPTPASFSLSAAAAFYSGFTPMSEAASAGSASLSLGFLVERTWEPVAAHLAQDADALHLRTTGASEEAALPQVRRMLGLDVDAAAWVALGEREPLVGALQREFPGFHTATFPSPYEAAVGGIVTQRTTMRQAAAIRRRLSESHGTVIDGIHVLPAPARMLEVDAVQGLPASKVPWLHGVARAALDGRLDAERLRAMPQDQALAELQSLPGIGGWTAAHALLRGAAPPDGRSVAEPRVLRAFSLLVGRELDERGLDEVLDRCRPFRMWVAILTVRHLAAVGGFAATPDDRNRRGRISRR